jgi:hypothetical protein
MSEHKNNKRVQVLDKPTEVSAGSRALRKTELQINHLESRVDEMLATESTIGADDLRPQKPESIDVWGVVRSKNSDDL